MASLLRRHSLILLGLLLISAVAWSVSAQTPRGHGAEARDMELVGHDDLQGRSAYQPTIFDAGGNMLLPRSTRVGFLTRCNASHGSGRRTVRLAGQVGWYRTNYPDTPIYVIAQVDQILSKHRRICCHPPTSAPPDGPTGKQACPAMECTG
jgi:hypothetical protein